MTSDDTAKALVSHSLFDPAAHGNGTHQDNGDVKTFEDLVSLFGSSRKASGHQQDPWRGRNCQ